MPLHTHHTDKNKSGKASTGQDDKQGRFSILLVDVQIGTATVESSSTLPSKREDIHTLRSSNLALGRHSRETLCAFAPEYT